MGELNKVRQKQEQPQAPGEKPKADTGGSPPAEAQAKPNGGATQTQQTAQSQYLLPQQDTLPGGGPQPGQSYSDWLMAHLAEAGKGFRQIGSTADDYVRASTDYLTGGLADRGAAALSAVTGLGGGDLAQQRAQTQAAHSNLGPAGDTAAFMTGFGSGFGKIKSPLLALAGYEGTRAAQEGTDPYSARVLTDPGGTLATAAGHTALDWLLGKAISGTVEPVARSLTRADPATVAIPHDELKFSSSGYPLNMTAADLADFAREMTATRAKDPAGAKVMIGQINQDLGRMTPEQLEATRQAYQALGGDIARPGATSAPPTAVQQALDWGGKAVGGTIGGWLGHQTGLPYAGELGVGLGVGAADKLGKAFVKKPPVVYPALSGGPAPTGWGQSLAPFGYYGGDQSIDALSGLFPGP